MDVLSIVYIILALAGQTIVWMIATNYQQTQFKAKQLVEREEIVTELSAAKQKIALNEHWREECKILRREILDLRNMNITLEKDLSKATTRLESIQLHMKDKIDELTGNEKRLDEQLENIANRIFERSHRKIDEQNQQKLNNLLTPLREQLDNFHRQILTNFNQEANERHTLAYEIHNLRQLNAQMVQEAFNLTRVLKGDNKIQGNWGEVVLTHVLEASGLRKGYEYETQVSIEKDIHSRMQPDVIVHLPDGKDVVIDAKMTLVSYERYFNAEDDCTRDLALREHITSVRNHIRQLGNKDYQQLPGLHTLDYVLMFIPIEPAFLLAIDKHPELITEALHNNIMLVSPTTLLVALRTILNLWRYENQNRNAQKIAERASKLYDKLRLFVEDMSSVGESLENAQNNYLQAMKKLSSGRGNLLVQAEKFHSLGVEIKRKINSELVEKVINHDQNHCLQ